MAETDIPGPNPQAPPPPPDDATLSFPCAGCGARLEYAPGTTLLRCPYCRFEQQIASTDEVIEEHSYDAWAAMPPKDVSRVGAHVLVCRKCSASTESDDLATLCAFCGAPVVADTAAADRIVPEAIVPFGVERAGARDAIRRWVSSRRFAPSRLKKVTAAETLNGTYLPHWTYDARTTTHYQGQRGQYYWVTENYTVVVDGESQVRTRQVRRTRWYPAGGTVRRDFDDVLVPGTTTLPQSRLDDLAPWSLERAVPFLPQFLVGYRALRYDVEPDQGLSEAKARMRPIIEQDCRSDIGGDEQRLATLDTYYAAIMFKLVLLPVWIATYVYGGRSYQVFVNAYTGRVIGQRPYSVPKIVATVLAALVAIAAVVTVLVIYRNS